MSAYKKARDLKVRTNSTGRYGSMTVTLEVLLQMEKIAEDLDKRLGIKFTRTQVLQHLIALYRKG